MEEKKTVRGQELKEIITDAMDDCISDEKSTAAEKLIALTAAVDL